MSWQYRKEGVFQAETVGPVSDADLLKLCFDGKVSGETLVVHPTRTKGQWAKLSAFPAALQKIDEGKRARAGQQAATRQAAEDRKVAERQAEASRRQSAPWAPFVQDGQSEAVVQKIVERVQQYLTPGEHLEYIAVQAKPVAIAPDCVVVTSNRLMIFRPKMLGQMEFQDFWWVNLGNAHVKEGMVYSTFSANSTDGRFISLDYLPKAQAAKLYRVAQHREQQAVEQRRQLDMERQRAGAMNLTVNSGSPTPGPVAPAADDPVAKLGKLKSMLDAGLISQAEYDATKARVLDSF